MDHSISARDAAIDQILQKYKYNSINIVQILRDVQSINDYISGATVLYLSRELKMSSAEIESVLQFYSFFYRENRGKYRVLFSDNITDRMAGNIVLFQHMLSRLKVQPGKVSEDGLVSVDLTSCTGMCDQGPAMLVNNYAITHLTARRIDEICDLIKSGRSVADWPAHYFRIEDNIRRAEILLGAAYRPGESLRAAMARGPEGMLAELSRSNLRGRGGAGFTTAVKWQACREVAAPSRVIICNADEGEPGTFKDRVLLQSFAGRVFEGMAIAGYTVGANKGFLYLRGEYLTMLDSLEKTLAEMRAARLLGNSILGTSGFDFDIEIHLGAGAYVCGEETALINSLEGKPGRPRIRPPFPVTSGYLGLPTVVNNVETLCKTTLIAVKGGQWYEGLGTKQSTGTKILSISGDCARPGLYEYTFGVRISEVLEECGAAEAIAVQVGGASGMCLSPQEFGRRIAFEDVPTAGAFMIFGKDRDLFEVARNFTHFFAHESCGFCTPCRVGTSLMRNMMDKIAAGRGTQYEINEMMRVREVMRSSSHCGLGQTAANSVFDTVQKFRPVYESRLDKQDFEPAFDLDAALDKARAAAGRDDADAHLGATE